MRSGRGRWNVLLPVVLLVASQMAGGPAAATTRQVRVVDTAFDPARVSLPAGSTVTWNKTEGVHNVSSTAGIFRSGDPTSSDFSFSRVFSAGCYPYLCELHGAAMKGAVRIRPRATTGPDGLPFRVRWATASTNTGTSFAVQYRVAGGSWRRWTVTDRFTGVFGRGGRPVRVVAGHRYDFRVQSRLGGSRSRFSPAVRFTP